MERTLKDTVNYTQLNDCSLDAAKQNKEIQDRPPKQQEEAYLDIPIYQYIKTIKWALHTRISHSTVCNTIVFTKKTRPTLMK